ncbi:hypothetical protein DITRI_Ditri02bG0019000 [Diplodiscus trichospermus]
MGSSGFPLFYSVVLSLATLTLSLNDTYFEYNCTQTSGNYTANSAYQANLNHIVSQFSSLTEFNYGFFNLSAGESPDKVYTITLCRGDLNQDRCNFCLNYTATELEQLCPSNKMATAWSEFCLVRYSNRDMYGLLENDPRNCASNPNNVANPAQYNQILTELLNNLSGQAAAGGRLRKYAAGSSMTADLTTVSALVQCTPDMDQKNCTECLTFAMRELRSCCYGRLGCRVLRPTCILRFESNSPFFTQIAVPLPPPPSSPTSTGENGNNKTRTVIIVIVSVVGSLILIIISICIFKKSRGTEIPKIVETADESTEVEISGVESLQFDLDSVRVATDNFSDANKLGQGGFGAVYKGMLPGDKEIAVKRPSRQSAQGDLEFKNEVLLVAKLEHRNLVRLFGFCLEGSERLLIYEFVPNKSLDHFIFNPINRAQLNWKIRYKIIKGIARGLLYLHEDSRLRIIHRDLKASNILLDKEMVPKIADFGLARLFEQDETQGNTRRIAGTYGYMAPEVIRGQFSVKSDVFSFGVLLLEIISGQKNNCFRRGEDTETIQSFAWRNWREGTALNVIDPTLSDESRNDILRCIHIALLCVQQNIAARPTMASVNFMLNSFSTTFPVPSQPAFLMQRNSESDSLASLATNSLATESNNEVSITELYPR